MGSRFPSRRCEDSFYPLPASSASVSETYQILVTFRQMPLSPSCPAWCSSKDFTSVSVSRFLELAQSQAEHACLLSSAPFFPPLPTFLFMGRANMRRNF